MLTLAKQMLFMKGNKKNLFDYTQSPTSVSGGVTRTLIPNGFRVSSSSGTYQYIAFNLHLLSNTQYTFSCDVSITQGDKTIKTVWSFNSILGEGYKTDTGVTTANGEIRSSLGLIFYAAESINEARTVEFTNMQLELGATATPYEPF